MCFLFSFLLSLGLARQTAAQTIQAENTSKLSGVKVQSTHANADGSYLDYGGEGTYAEWQFASSTDQTVELKIKYSTGNSSRGLKLTVNGNSFGTKSPLTNTDDWEDWEITGWTNVALQAGNNTIRLTAVGAGPNLDRLNIVPNDDSGDNGGENSGAQGSFNTLRVNANSLPSAYKVAVNGGIITDEVRIQLNEYWPDYVFTPTYSLLDLTELAQFIQQNKHLPGLKSATEVEKEGHFDLGQLNVKLLEKIEELTRYAIEQDKENTQLQKKLKAQETRLKVLEKALETSSNPKK